MEANFVAFSAIIQKSLWLKWFLHHLGVNANTTNLVLVNCNSQAATRYTNDSKCHCKTKHIDTKYNFVKDMVAHKELNMKYISMCKMVANPLTKPIP